MSWLAVGFRSVPGVCGVAGWVRVDGVGGADVPLDRMAAAMRHRGPDDVGLVRFAGGGLAARRLALLDVPGGHQPVANERETLWGVFNGELYNHRELRDDLVRRGHRIYSHCDSELIPHMYEEWGAEMVTRLRGMFALAVFAPESGELFLARDPFGIKPLYYVETPGKLVFASEARALLAGGVGADVDATSVWHYLSFGYVPDPATMWRGVRRLAPGHHLTFRDGKLSLHRYWRPEFEPDQGVSLTESADAIERSLNDSVTAHLDADVPVGAYLSSGVDSSLLVALAAQRRPVQTFSVGFEGSRSGHEELTAARALAAQLGTDHHEELISARDYCDALPDIAGSQEEPLADPSAPALWFLARAAGRHVKAVLSGEGADELFAGYPMFLEPGSLRAVEALPGPLRLRIGRVAGRLPDGMRGKSFLERGSTPLARRFLGNAPIYNEDEKRRLMATAFAGEEFPASSFDVVAPYYAAADGADDVTKMQTVSCQTWLPGSILMKADKMGMAHSVEVRVPFLDREVFAAAAPLPLTHRIGGGQTKIALRTAAARVLPAATAQRPKLGFPVPFRSWLDGELGALLRELVVSSDDPLLDRRAVETLVDQGAGPGQYRQQWSLLSYLLWRQAIST